MRRSGGDFQTKEIRKRRTGKKNRRFPQMKMFRSMRMRSISLKSVSARLILMALLVAVIPASSYAGVFVSVAIAPPVLPVYVQPPCPEPGLMWTPGYWAYGDDGYYWVPGTWVPAPYEGALWTPGYWGWGGGLYVFHPGYWGPHVGYYGGVNYGFGYMGVGFAGGLWVGGAFRYNTAVMHVNTTVIHNTYVDNTIVHNTTIVNNNRVAYSGGPGGINHAPTAQENAYSHEQHRAATSFQTQHQSAAMHNTAMYASHNGGHPANAAVARPMGVNGGVNGGAHANIGSQSSGSGAGKVNTYAGAHGSVNTAPRMNTTPQVHNNTAPVNNAPRMNTTPQAHNNTAPVHNEPQMRTAPAQHQAPPAHGGGEPHNEGGHEHGH
jgi:WXXGXW repeat (2 copies)